MRSLFVLSLFVSAVALADVGPPPPKCVVPSQCRTCATSLADETLGADCRAQAADAGLVRSDCTDRSGVSVSEYYCPSGKQAVRGCGCSSAEALSGALAALVSLALRRRRAPLPGRG